MGSVRKFFSLLSVLVNACINMTEVTGKCNRSRQLVFRRALVSQLLEKNDGQCSDNKRTVTAVSSPPRSPRPPRPRALSAASTSNAVVPTPSTSGVRRHRLVKNRSGASRRCRVCQVYRRQRHESRWWCPVCGVHICREATRDCFQLHKLGMDMHF